MSVQLELGQDLHQALTELMAAIAESPGLAAGLKPVATGRDIPGLIRRIDQIRAEWGAQTPKMLRHYLDKRSYAKALDFLEGRDETAAPNC